MGYPAPAVAIVGLAARVPGARDVEELWLNLIRGRPLYGRPGSAAGGWPDAAELDAGLFATTADEAER